MTFDSILDFLIIRVKVDDFAMRLNSNDTYSPICIASQIKYNEKYDCICQVQYINIFGVVAFPKIIKIR